MKSTRLGRAFISLCLCLAAMAAMTQAARAQDQAPTGQDQQAREGSKPKKQGPVTLRIADRSVNFGGRFRLRGKTGNPYKGQVLVQAFTGKSWRNLRRVTTDHRGRYSTRIRARVSTAFRVRTNDDRHSDPKRVTVIGHVKLARSARYVKLGGRLTIRGTVVPRGVRRLRIRVGGDRVISTRTRANGRFRIRWKPRRNGDFTYRVRMLPSSRSTGDSSLRRRFSALRPGHASYYGPGLYGNGVACGGTLTPSTRGVAHKSLPCGTRVTLQYGKRTVVARVIDRGPYIAGRDWDLTEQTKRDLGFGGVGVVWTNK